jgi:hypothetical protein
MERVNIDNNQAVNESNENMLIEMSAHFKNLYEKLKNENIELKKLLLVAYSLFRISNDSEFEVDEIGRSYFSEQLDNYFFDKPDN